VTKYCIEKISGKFHHHKKQNETFIDADGSSGGVYTILIAIQKEKKYEKIH